MSKLLLYLNVKKIAHATFLKDIREIQQEKARKEKREKQQLE